MWTWKLWDNKKYSSCNWSCLHLSVQIQLLECCSVSFQCTAMHTFQVRPRQTVLPIKSVILLFQSKKNRPTKKQSRSSRQRKTTFIFDVICISWNQFAERDPILKTLHRSHLPEGNLITRFFSLLSSCSVSYNRTFLAHMWGTTNS